LKTRKTSTTSTRKKNKKMSIKMKENLFTREIIFCVFFFLHFTGKKKVLSDNPINHRLTGGLAKLPLPLHRPLGSMMLRLNKTRGSLQAQNEGES
jgi:hypothetical protein